jgi:hypothetical protein
MKPAITCAEWSAVSEHLDNAIREVAELANILDRRVATEQLCEDAKRVETELCVLESRLRHLRKQSESHPSAISV